jgi:hypothetical protein
LTKKIFYFLLFTFYFLAVAGLPAFASPLGTITPPPGVDVGPGPSGIINIIKGIVNLMMVIGFIGGLFCLIISAIGYISSGGDPKAAAAARGRIMACIVGIMVLLSIFAIIFFLQVFFGANIITGIPIPIL